MPNDASLNSLNKKCSQLQESNIAAYLGWQVVSGSGAAAGHPGDICSTGWLGECKTHVSTGHKIAFIFSVWEKICNEAGAKFKYPVLFVDDGSQKIDRTWVLFNNNLVTKPNMQVVESEDVQRYVNSSSIRFSHSDMSSIYYQFVLSYSLGDTSVVLAVHMPVGDFAICPLVVFERLFGGGIC